MCSIMGESREASVKVIERKHRGRWLAIRITKETADGRALRGVLVAQAKSAAEIWGKVHEAGLYVFRAGPRKRRAMVLRSTGSGSAFRPS
jgi:hypothetical protein